MKKLILCVMLLQSLSSASEISNCEDYLKKADTALNDINRMSSGMPYDALALLSSAYMQRYRLCMERKYGGVSSTSVKQDTSKLKNN